MDKQDKIIISEQEQIEEAKYDQSNTYFVIKEGKKIILDTNLVEKKNQMNIF